MKHTLPYFFFLFFITTSYAQDGAWREVGTLQKAPNTYIQVFPNPATSYFGITEIDGVEKILVFNLVGRKMKQFQGIAKDKRYFIGDLPRGMYLVQMLDKQSKVITTRRISKR